MIKLAQACPPSLETIRPFTPPPQEAAHYQGQAGVDRWPAAAAEPLPVAQLASPSIAQNSRGNLTQLKDQFRVQVQDHWDRRSRGDPAVNHDIAYKAHGWSNYLNRGSTASSEELGRKHSRSQIEANRKSYDSLMPRLTVYHRSTLQ